MKIDQTVENHDDLLRIVDNLLSEAGLARKDFRQGTISTLEPSSRPGERPENILRPLPDMFIVRPQGRKRTLSSN